MAERRSSHIRGRRAPDRTPNHAWRDRVLGCSLALSAVAAATEAAATDACPHAEFAPNPWFTCLGAEARPVAPDSSPDGWVVVSDDGTVTVDAAGDVVGVFAEGSGRVTTNGAGDVEIRTAGEGALGVALVGGPSVAGLAGQPVIAGPVPDAASVWFESPAAAADDRGRLFVFGADGTLRLPLKPPVAEGANVLGLGGVSTADGVTAESVYLGPDGDQDEAGRSISVHGAQGVGVELSTPGAADPASGWERGAGAYGLEDFARSWDGGSNRHVFGASPPRGRDAPPPAAEAPPQILIGGASADASDSRGAPSSAGADFVAAPSAAVAPEAYAALSVAGAAQTFWGQSADAWSARARTLRDRPGGEGVQAWVQAHGGAETLDRGAAVKLTASWRGVQAGIDRRSTQGARSLWWGATVGFTDYDADAGPDAFELRGANLGAYAGGQWGGFYAAALVKADVIDAEAALGALSRRSFDGASWGARGEVGYRIGSARLFLEPSAALAWVEADLDGFSDAGTSFAYDDAASLRGRTGVRLGGEATIGNAVFVPYVGVHAAAEFDGENRMRVTDGGTFQLVDAGRGSWGEAEVGVSGATWFGLEAFAEAKALSGGDVRGWSARLGARWRW